MNVPNQGPHSAMAWLAMGGLVLLIALFNRDFLGAILGIVGFIGFVFVVFKVIGGSGGLFK